MKTFRKIFQRLANRFFRVEHKHEGVTDGQLKTEAKIFSERYGRLIERLSKE